MSDWKLPIKYIIRCSAFHRDKEPIYLTLKWYEFEELCDASLGLLVNNNMIFFPGVIKHILLTHR